MVASLRFAVLGAGHGAGVYIPALLQAGQVPVVLASRRQHPNLAIDQTRDWHAAIARTDVDAVVIALPPALQLEAVVAAAAAAKPFICEKPAGMNESQARVMRDTAMGHAHAVGFQFRYEPAFAELRRLVRNGTVGRIEHIEVDWYVGAPQARSRPWSWRNDVTQGGGIVLNFATHALDYIRWLSACQPRTLGRTTQVLVSERPDEGGAMRPVTAPDACDFLLGLDGCAIASLRVCNLAQLPLGHRVVVRGRQGTATLWHRPPFRDVDMELSLASAGKETRRLGAELGMQPPGQDSRISPTVSLIKAFLTRLEGRGDAPSLDDALAVHSLAGGAG